MIEEARILTEFANDAVCCIPAYKDPNTAPKADSVRLKVEEPTCSQHSLAICTADWIQTSADVVSLRKNKM